MSQLEDSREVKAFQTILVCDWIIILEIEGKCPESPNDDVSMIISEAYLDSDTECAGSVDRCARGHRRIFGVSTGAALWAVGRSEETVKSSWCSTLCTSPFMPASEALGA